MKRILNKLLSKKGESLIESLCAILIFTLASVAMYSMVMASADINSTAKDMDRSIQEQMLVAEKAEGTCDTGTITLTIKPTAAANATATVNVQVDVYQSENDGLYSYFRNGG